MGKVAILVAALALGGCASRIRLHGESTCPPGYVDAGELCAQPLGFGVCSSLCTVAWALSLWLMVRSTQNMTRDALAILTKREAEPPKP